MFLAIRTDPGARSYIRYARLVMDVNSQLAARIAARVEMGQLPAYRNRLSYPPDFSMTTVAPLVLLLAVISLMVLGVYT